jgi:hypothetical protein
MKTLAATTLFGAALLLTTACEVAKSANPLQPAVSAEESTQPTPGAAPIQSLSGEEVVAQVMARYPERLAAGVSHEQRVANMEFLRDRIIEEGRCSGLRLAWNLKRGTGPRSIDAIVWQHGTNNVLDVIDIALAYDDTRSPLRLHWLVVAGPAGWDPGQVTACPAA